ncbi:transporter, CPA2 family [Peptoclostridium litorale DSM 5388]|uniref:Na(+)/H(+) antiporter n=1 Tax=Peptoclostridium litorale DSM 5388 TaxID=1121324 RepID=A0A069RPF8_PEPLI|nr:cation:proton antiporter [Peptoclostridium litorale]KDR96057.1 Na(+)/H(+) antiporter [Peptoclostridium litorale DSM 5388]SIO05661.1 transporter, CPA2 family [Peptoclostridium litorale DSM 5388]
MNPFISLGIAIISAILFGQLMNKFKIPAVAGYVVAGLVIGVSGLKLVDNATIEKLGFLSDLALGIIAFNIGSELKFSEIKKLGKPIFIIALCEALGAFILVTGAMLLLKQNIATALILGAVSSATAPAATVMVLKECKAKGPLTSTLLGVVAVDDAICLMIYAMSASVAKVFIKHEVITVSKIIIHPVMEIVFSVATGLLMGVALAYLLKRAKKESELLSLVIGMIILLAGVAIRFNLSPLLSAMAVGVAIANISSKDKKVFLMMESFSPPIVAAFFVLAGCRLDISLLPKLGIVGAAYLVVRVIGKISGASMGGAISKAPETVKKYIGFGLLSQVGVAVGLAIVVSREFPGTALGSMVITILLATTIITEIIGPVATKNAVIRAGEINE